MNFFQSLISEQGAMSSKRWISVTSAAALVFAIVWTIVKYPQYIPDTIHSTMLFILVMSGVATIAQITSIIKGTPEQPEPQKT
jgi:ribosome-associated toxin RatA of RatAB toxin-antitoxin module